MKDVPKIIFYGDDILVQAFIRRYVDKAKRVPGYEEQVAYLESKLKDIEEYFHSDIFNTNSIPRGELR